MLLFTMPLVIISGLPSSGKSSRASELRDYFVTRDKKVQIVTENVAVPKAGFKKNEFFESSQKEKIVRADIKSEGIRLLNKDDVVIIDAGNYIKGYRYELHCASKAARTTQCTLFCGIRKEIAWEFNCSRSKTEQIVNEEQPDPLNDSNEVYDRDVFDGLCLRYEEPHGNNRWDSPLFTVIPGDSLDVVGIYAALFESKPPPPNQSTQNPPLSGTNYLFEMDRLTQDIISTVVSARKIGALGPVTIKPNVIVNVPADMNASQLNRLRRQFLNYNKMHTSGSNLDAAPQLFVQFLNSNFSQ